MTDYPTISVVTPTHNRKESLLRLLRALRDNEFPPGRFEAVVVADGCSDDTARAVGSERYPFPVRLLEQMPGRGAAAARNLGAKQTRGELLVFLDDDIEPLPGLLAEHERVHAALGVPALVIGPPQPVRRRDADWAAIGAWDWWEEQFAAMRSPGHRFAYDNVFSGNMSIPAALFFEAGGFDLELESRHDYELGLKVLRCGARIAFAPRAAGWHHESRDKVGFVKRKLEEGKGDVRLAQHYPELWPVLPLSRSRAARWSARGVLRQLAFTAPWLGDVVVGVALRMLDVLQFLRLRGSWRNMQGAVLYYGYWRGVASAIGCRREWRRLRASCATTTEEDHSELELDLRDGVAAVEVQLDTKRPDGVRLRFGDIEIGRIAPHPGAEPLRGAHLRQALATHLAQSLIAALSVSAMVCDPCVWPLLAPPQPPDSLTSDRI